MTDNQPNATEQYPVLLGWQMPVLARTSLGVLALVIGVAAFVVVATLTSRVAHYTQGGLGIIGLLVWMRLAAHLLIAFECLGPGINLQALFSRVTGERWEEVQSLKRMSGGLISLRFRKGWYLLVGLPKPAANQLVSILREATNARIIGFDEGT